jgi:transposase
LIFRPPYSPDLNPIEQVFSKLKTLVRKARARSIDGMADAIRESLPRFLPDECRNYSANSGYTST